MDHDALIRREGERLEKWHKLHQAPRGEGKLRNCPCSCGSGRKYKKCCLGKPTKTKGGA